MDGWMTSLHVPFHSIHSIQVLNYQASKYYYNPSENPLRVFHPSPKFKVQVPVIAHATVCPTSKVQGIAMSTDRK